jgi:hypothetical protein
MDWKERLVCETKKDPQQEAKKIIFAISFYRFDRTPPMAFDVSSEKDRLVGKW